MEPVISRPDPSTCGPFGRYISLVESNLFPALTEGFEQTLELLRPVDEDRSTHRYAEGKWSIKQVVGHITDAERIFVYRATCVARNDSSVLPSFDENAYVDNANFDALPFRELMEEYKAVRQASIQFFRHVSPEALDRSGMAGPNKMSVRAWGFTVAGHDAHHRKLLRERYLNV